MPIRSRLFKRYVLSYFSVVLAVCMAMGLALVRAASGQLRQAETEVYQARLAQTGDYIERQLSAMEDIRLDVKTRLQFQPFSSPGRRPTNLSCWTLLPGTPAFRRGLRNIICGIRTRAGFSAREAPIPSASSSSRL